MARSSVLPDLGVAGYDPLKLAGDAYYYDERSAERAIIFIEGYLRHIKGEWAGRLLKLEDWQRRVVRNLFGWRRTKDDLRRYLELFLYVPRKNAKSTLAAALMLYLFFCGGEPGAEFYTIAADREQAGIVFDMAAEMIRLDPRLDPRATIRQSKITRRGETTGLSIFRALSSEVGSKHGYNAAAIACDELHAHPNAGLYEVLTTSMAARRSPLTLMLTTADQIGESLCNEKLKYARGVRDGDIDDSRFLPVIYETMPEDDWTSPEVWARANPNLGVSVSLEYLERECQRAKTEPTYENTFRRLHLNCQTEQAERWLDMAKWDLCAGIARPVPEGVPIVVGVDLATTNDLAAVVSAYRLPTGEVALHGHYYAPEARANEREQRQQRPSYRAWERSGWLTLTPGNAIHYAQIERDIAELAERCDVRVLALDPWNAHSFAQNMLDAGIRVEFVKQGYASLSWPSKEFHRLLLEEQLRPGADPVLRWMAGNVALATDPAGNIKPDKSRSGDKIDGIVASVMAVLKLELLEDYSLELFSV